MALSSNQSINQSINFLIKHIYIVYIRYSSKLQHIAGVFNKHVIISSIIIDLDS